VQFSRDRLETLETAGPWKWDRQSALLTSIH
jgi:hypothetical protein